jgi:acyl carrier protein
MAIDRQILTAFLKTRFGLAVESLDDEEALFSSGLLDSFNVTEVVSFVEEQTGCMVEADDLSFENLDSVGRIVRFAGVLTARGQG